jgi:hypothetical protein
MHDRIKLPVNASLFKFGTYHNDVVTSLKPYLQSVHAVKTC